MEPTGQQEPTSEPSPTDQPGPVRNYSVLISYSKSYPLSEFLCGIAEDVAVELGFDVARFKDRSGQSLFDNMDQTPYARSIDAALDADVTVAIVLRNYGGGFVDSSSGIEGADGSKTICRHEYEAARGADRHAVALVEAVDFEKNILDVGDDVYFAGFDKDLVKTKLTLSFRKSCEHPEQLKKQQEAHSKFKDSLSQIPNVIEFSGLEDFQSRLRGNLERWLKKQQVVVALPRRVDVFPSRQPLVDQLAKLMMQSGSLVVAGPVAVGKTELAIQAGHQVADAKKFSRILYSKCRRREPEKIARELCSRGRLRRRKSHADQLDCLRDHLSRKRCLIVLDSPSAAVVKAFKEVAHNDTTLVFVTHETKIVKLVESQHPPITVNPLRFSEIRELVKRWIPDHYEAETAACDSLARMLGGLPKSLKAACEDIGQDELSSTPVASFIEQWNANGRDLANTFLKRMPEDYRASFLVLVGLPHVGLTTELAATALNMPENNVHEIINRLIGRHFVYKLASGRWRLERGHWRAFNKLADNAETKLARDRLASFFRKKFLAEGADHLATDADLALDLLVPQVIDSTDENRKLVNQLSELAKRTGRWQMLVRLWRGLLETPSSQLPKNHKYYLWQAGQALTRTGNYEEGEEFCRKAIELAGDKIDHESAMYYSTLGSNLSKQGRFAESVGILRRLLDFESQRPGRGVYIVQHLLGRALWLSGKHSEAVELLDASVASGEQHRDTKHLCEVYVTRGETRANQGRLDEALEDLRLADESAKRSSRFRQRPMIAYYEGMCWQRKSELRKAQDALERARTLLDGRRQRELEFKIHVGLIDVYRRLHDEAKLSELRELANKEESSEKQAMMLFPLVVRKRQELIGDPAKILSAMDSIDPVSLTPNARVILLHQKGQHLQELDRLEEAIPVFEDAFQIAQSTGNQRSISITVLSLAAAFERHGAFQRAQELLQERLEDPACDLTGKARISTHLGMLFKRLRKLDDAAEMLNRSIEYEKELGENSSSSLARPLHQLAMTYQKQGKYPAAEPLLLNALKEERSDENKRGEMIVLHSLAVFELNRGRFSRADDYLGQSMALVEPGDDPRHEVRVLHLKSRLALKKGDKEAAIEHLTASMDISDTRLANRQFAKHSVLSRAELANHLSSVRAIDILVEADKIAREHRLWDETLLIAQRLARQLDDSTEAGATQASKILEEAALLGIDLVPTLRWTYHLQRVIMQLASLHRRTGKLTEGRQHLEKVLSRLEAFKSDSHQYRVAKLKSFADSALGQILAETDRSSPTPEAPAHYRAACDEAIEAGVYFGLRHLLLDWVIMVATAGDLEGAVELIEEYSSKIAADAPPRILCSLAKRRGDLLASLARRLNAQNRKRTSKPDEPDLSERQTWISAYRQYRLAERYARKADSKFQEFESVLKRTALLLDMNDERRARILLERCSPSITQALVGDLEDESANWEDVKTSIAIQLAEVIARIDLQEALDWLASLDERTKQATDNLEDFILILNLKFRLLVRSRPWSCYQVLTDAHDFAVERQDLGAQASILTLQARLHVLFGDVTRATRKLQTAVEVHKGLGDVEKHCDLLRRLSLHLQSEVEDRAAALEVAETALGQLVGLHGWRRIRVQLSIAKLNRELDNLAAAEDVATSAIAEARQLNSASLEASGHLTLAAIQAAKYEMDKSAVSYSTAMELVRYSPTSRVFRYALGSLASIRYQIRDLKNSIINAQEYLEFAETLGYPFEEVLAVRKNLAKAFRQIWLPKLAIEQVELALAELRQNEDVPWKEPQFIGWQRWNWMFRLERGLILQITNRQDEAGAELEALVQERVQSRPRQNQPLDDNPQWRVVLISHAKLSARLGNDFDADWITECRELLDDDPRHNAIFCLDMAQIQQSLGDHAEAADSARKSLEISDHMLGNRQKYIAKASAHSRLSSLAFLENDLTKAVDEAELARKDASRSNSVQQTIIADEILVRWLNKAGEFARAAQVAEEALAKEQKLLGDLLTAPPRLPSLIRVTLHDRAAIAYEGLGNQERCDQHLRAAEECRSQLASAGIEHLPLADEAEPQADATLANPAPDAGKPEIGDIESGVVDQIRADGIPRGVEVRLSSGHLGFLEMTRAFAGLTGDLNVRYRAGDTYSFRIIGKPQDDDPQGKFELEPEVDPAAAWADLDGQIVSAKILDLSHLEDQLNSVVIQIASGERFELPYPGEGWGIDKVEAQLWTEKKEVFAKLSIHNGQLKASIRGALQPVLEQLRDSRKPISGVIVRRDQDGIWIRLAPAVIAFCRAQDAVSRSKNFERLRPKSEIAVEVLTVHDVLGITVSRLSAIKQILSRREQRFTKGVVITKHDDGKYLVGLGTSIVGTGHSKEEWRPKQKVIVRIDGEQNPKQIHWEYVERGSETKKTRPLESAPSLMEAVADTIDSPAPPSTSEEPVVASSHESRSLLETYRGFTLQEYQSRAIRCVDNGDNLVLWAPTGSGKTLVAEWAMEQTLDRRRRAIFASPVKALSNQKFHDFVKLFGQDRVGMITGDVEINPLASVLVLTTEIFRNRAIEYPESLQHFDLAVFDEIHYLDDKSRGSTWEESIVLAPKHMQILALSATIPNSKSLVEWLSVARPERRVQVVPETRLDRPVELVHHFVGLDYRLERFGDWQMVPDDWLVNPDLPVESKPDEWKKNALKRTVPPRYGALAKNMVRLIHWISPKGLPAIFFCPRQDLCQAYAEQLSGMGDSLISEEQGQQNVEEFTETLLAMGVKDNADVCLLRELVGRGIAYHHAGLLPSLKMVVEQLFRSRRIGVVFATDTFAVGVDMPARSVFLSTLNKGSGSKARSLRYREFAQMSGRAGRLSKEIRDKQGDVYVFLQKNKKTRHGEFTREQLKRFEKGPEEVIQSHFDPDYRTLLNVRCQLGMSLESFWENTFAAIGMPADETKPLKSRMFARWKVLQQLGYVDAKDQITKAGEVCSAIADQELVITEAFTRCHLTELEPVQLAAFMGSLACSHSSFGVHQKMAVVPKEWSATLANRLREVIEIETNAGLEEHLRLPIVRIEPVFKAWAEGASFAETQAILKNIPDGTLVMWIRQAIQLIVSLTHALDPDSLDVLKLLEAKSLLQRDEVVTAISSD